jgi:arylsulfatase A-like enzyme
MLNNLSRRSFCRIAAGTSAALALTPRLRAAQPAKLQRKPNLLVFLSDQQRADTLACYGGTRVHAINLNKLASQSFVFEQAYVTQPICAPSRSSLLTGTWPHNNGCTHNHSALAPRFRCLPELINDSDYRCAYMGKWDLGDEVFAQHGFAEWVSIMDVYRDNVTPGRDRNAISDYGRFLLAKGLVPDEKKKGIFSHDFVSRLPLELSKPKFLETKACEFLERHTHDPFLLIVSFFEPHPPYNGPLNNEHPLEEIDVDPTASQIFGSDMPLRYQLRQQNAAKVFDRSPENYRHIKQRYLGLVTELDQSIGAILGKLEALQIAANTIVAHTSDHGEMMGAHGLFGQRVLFQQSARVPLLVHLPDQRSIVGISRPVSHIDFAPTIVDLLGKPAHEQCVGKSWAAWLRGESTPAEPVFLEWAPEENSDAVRSKPEEIRRAMTESTRAIISPDGWKLCLRDKDKNELYNLEKDPREEHNLFYQGGDQKIIDQLTAAIHDWQQRSGDTLKV